VWHFRLWPFADIEGRPLFGRYWGEIRRASSSMHTPRNAREFVGKRDCKPSREGALYVRGCAASVESSD